MDAENASIVMQLKAEIERLQRDNLKHEAALAEDHLTIERLTAELAAAKAQIKWLDSNTTFYDVIPDGPDACTSGPNIPVLASVSERIWYHATDDRQSYPFSEVIRAALTDKQVKD